MDIYERFKTLNSRLIRGENIPFSEGIKGLSNPSGTNRDKPLAYPAIAIYAGQGASHSWLWFVDLFDRMGLYDLCFLTDTTLKENGLRGIDVLAMSGGDTFAIAEGLGKSGAREIERFIRSGGLYIGSCAGAYLPLNSSKPFLNLFNYVPAKITNLTRSLPTALRLKEKFCTSYGCSFIFHPVRETVELKTNGFAPFGKPKTLLAPLYGGPPMTLSDPAAVLVRYTGFTDHTLFLVDRKLAEETVLGKAAVIRKKMGAGHFHLYGPHFEHPRFPTANHLMAAAMYWDLRRGNPPCPRTDALQGNAFLSKKSAKHFIRAVKREISNARIVAAGLEMQPVQWTIGNKVYDPGKIRVFLEAIWSRLGVLEKAPRLCIQPGQDGAAMRHTASLTSLVRATKRDWDQARNTPDMARTLFSELSHSSMLFLDIYFRTQAYHFGGIHEA
ncbi:MAG: BPL-N domain-containing protein [Desulfobacteraceae bacterium]